MVNWPVTAFHSQHGSWCIIIHYFCMWTCSDRIYLEIEEYIVFVWLGTDWFVPTPQATMIDICELNFSPSADWGRDSCTGPCTLPKHWEEPQGFSGPGWGRDGGTFTNRWTICIDRSFLKQFFKIKFKLVRMIIEVVFALLPYCITWG